MRCTQCDADIPEDGRFCIECGAPAPLATTGPTERLPEPADGPMCTACGTRNPVGADFCVRCGRALAARPVAEPLPPPLLAQPQPSAPLVPTHNQPVAAGSVPARPTISWDGLTGGVWLIGLGIIALNGWWWPGILVLIGLSSLLSGLAHANSPAARLGAIQGAMWMIGIAVLAATGWWWPGILILVGLSAVFGSVVMRED